ncbi:unnamed protein product [Phytophthora fragariaefolia]|uniref:Unnamed protein product n=1 Tax=Phytophthora fragariaefolia TaxID=1490495 RepID=A0A9W6YJG0_9STRA|nr:unnamed protein product [Phytophthora fragariaefolia]
MWRDNLLIDTTYEYDLKAVGDGEDADEYGAMYSGDDAERINLEVEDDDDDRCYAGSRHELEEKDAEPTASEIAAGVKFPDKCMSTFGGDDAVLASNLENDALREMSESDWKAVDEPDMWDYMITPFETVRTTQSYPVLRQRYLGPSQIGLLA